MTTMGSNYICGGRNNCKTNQKYLFILNSFSEGFWENLRDFFAVRFPYRLRLVPVGQKKRGLDSGLNRSFQVQYH